MSLFKAIKKKIRQVISLCQKFVKINLTKTLLMNFCFLEFKQAKKFPIIVYGKLKIRNYDGTIRLPKEVKMGMIKLGKNTDGFSASKGSSSVLIAGDIIFKGRFISSVDISIEVAYNRQLIFGNCVFMGNGAKIRCWEHIEVGDFSRLAAEVQVFDTNFHFMRNTKTGEIPYYCAPIYIGSYSWIGNRVSVMKGTKLPNYTTVASNSLLNKDYTSQFSEGTVLAGSPAKVVATGYVRVFSMKRELECLNHYCNGAGENYFSIKGYEDESAEIEAFFDSL